MRATTFVCLLSILFVTGNAFPIKYLIVLMMENRSFDHLLGFLHLTRPEVDGLTGKETNPYDTTDPKSKVQQVNQNGFDTGPDDPLHDWDSTTEQIFGYALPPRAKGDPKMNGFVQNALNAGNTPYNPMSMFTPKSAPIINTLANEFAVFDKWFASLPGPTDPNRAFFMSGTSNGMIENFNGTLWGQQSYFDWLGSKGVSWRAYYQDDPWAIMYYQDMHEAKNVKNVFQLDQFFTDVKNGDLAQYTVLQPRMLSHEELPTWQHPDASVTEGERLYKSIYEALRASSLWEELAFVVTYDEHGGFYDHVPPPQTGIPSPDGVVAPNGFQFDRLGIRIPTIVVSPWIPRNTVVHEADGPTPTSHYDTTSIIATANKIFGISESMHARDAWAGTFEHVFSLSSPRTDCPAKLPEIPPADSSALERQQTLPLNEHMRIQVEFYCTMNGHEAQGNLSCSERFINQYEASVFIATEATRFMGRLRAKI